MFPHYCGGHMSFLQAYAKKTKASHINAYTYGIRPRVGYILPILSSTLVKHASSYVTVEVYNMVKTNLCHIINSTVPQVDTSFTNVCDILEDIRDIHTSVPATIMKKRWCGPMMKKGFTFVRLTLFFSWFLEKWEIVVITSIATIFSLIFLNFNTKTRFFCTFYFARAKQIMYPSPNFGKWIMSY